MNLTNLRLNDCIQTQKIYSVLFHLYRVEKWMKLVYGDRGQKRGGPETITRKGFRETQMLCGVFY